MVLFFQILLGVVLLYSLLGLIRPRMVGLPHRPAAILVGVLGGLLVIVAAGLSSDETIEPEPKTVKAEKKAPDINSVQYRHSNSVTSDQLCQAYGKNPVAAKQEYFNRILYVWGWAEKIDIDLAGKPYVQFKDESGVRILAYLQSEDNAAQIEPGGNIEVVGVVGEYKASILKLERAYVP